MRTAYITYRRMILVAIAIVMLCFGEKTFAQDCERNMLYLPDSSSFAVVPNTSGIDLKTGFTIEWWMKATTFKAGAGIIEQSFRGDTGAVSIRYGNTRVLEITLKLNTGIITLITPSLPTIQNWNHFAITFTPNDSIRVYVNGDLVLTKKTKATSLSVRADTLFIGHSQLSRQTFLGNIDELRFWSVARTQSAIRSTDSIPLTGREQNLTAYYRFDDRTELQRIHDFTNRGSEGIIRGSGECVVSTSPITPDRGSGYMLASKEKFVDLGVHLCDQSVPAKVQLYNRGFDTLRVGSRGFVFGGIFNVVDDAGFPLEPDTTHIGIVNIQVDFLGRGTFYDTLIVITSSQCGGSVRIPFKIRFEEAMVVFADSVFEFPPHVDCETTRPEVDRELVNTGSVPVTIDTALFTSNVGVELVSPKTPFTIDSGKSVILRLRENPGLEGNFSTILHVRIKECSHSADLLIKGKRTHLAFSIPERIDFPLQQYSTAGISLDTFFVLRNTGSAELFASPIKITGAGYKFLTPTSSYRNPGTFDTIRFHFDTNSCGIFPGRILIKGKPCGLDTSIPILVTVASPELAPLSSTLDIGATCQSKDTIITFVNRSNIKVTLSLPSFSKKNVFSLVDSSNFPIITNPGDTVRIRLRFAPAVEGEHSLQARFLLAPCGESIVQLHGILGVGKISLSNTTIDFPHGCDLGQQQLQILLTNEAGRAVAVTNANITGSNNFTLVESLPITILAGGQRKLTIRYTPTSFSADEAVMTLRENGCYITSFPLRGSREHANVAWTNQVINFDTTCPGHSTQRVIELQNNGTTDQTIDNVKIIGAGNAFSILNANGRVITPGATESFFVDFHPNAIGEVDDTAEFILSPCNDTTRIVLHGVGGPKPHLVVSEKNLSFGRHRIGTKDTMCVTISNPSCLPLTIPKDGILISFQKFSLTDASVALLPAVLSDSNSISLCVVFHPSVVSSSRGRIVISSGDEKDTITLSGDGVAPDTFYSPITQVVEFGDVLLNKSSTLPLVINNKSGGDSTGLSFTGYSAPYSISPLPTRLDRNSDTSLQITFKPDALGLVIQKLLVRWDLRTDTIILRGRGVGAGVLLSKTLVQFGDVRVGHDAVDTVIVTASEGYPITLSQVRFSGMDSNQFIVTPLQTSSTLTSASDTLRYELHFTPNAERIFTSNFILRDDNQERGRISATGRGVEAHLVLLDTPFVDFGPVDVGTTLPQNIRIYNSGLFPLQLGPQPKTSLPDIFLVDLATNTLVNPGDTILMPVSFKPGKAILYTDVLTVFADAPEQQKSLWLRGTGRFGAQGFPLVAYDIPDAEVRVGEILDIPIYISGRDLPLLTNVDSFAIRLQYDPSVVFIHGVKNENTILQSMQISMTRERHDSAVLITAHGAVINPRQGVLLYLKTEALLGRSDSTRIEVVDALPQNTAPTFQSSGLYYVTDCGNYRTNIAYKGPYSVSQSSPNPASNNITINYEIGLDGFVSIDLYDGVGKMVKSIVRQYQKAGKYVIQKMIDDLPSGEYTYILQSLEYQGKGKLIISK